MQEQNIHWRKHWRDEGLTRIPYSLYTDTDLPEQEQERIFRGNTWNYLCLDAELAEPGSYRTTFAGSTPVVVVRDSSGSTPVSRSSSSSKARSGASSGATASACSASA